MVNLSERNISRDKGGTAHAPHLYDNRRDSCSDKPDGFILQVNRDRPHIYMKNQAIEMQLYPLSKV